MKTITLTLEDDHAESMKKEMLAEIRYRQERVKVISEDKARADKHAEEQSLRLSSWQEDLDERVRVFTSAFGPVPEPEDAPCEQNGEARSINQQAVS